MRLILLTQDFPPDVGGTQTYAHEMALRLATWCDAFAVVAPKVEGCEALDASLPFEVYRVEASYNTLSFKAYPTLSRLATEQNMDTILNIQWPTLLSSILLRKRGKIQHVFTAAHGRELLFMPASTSLLNGLYDGLRWKLLKAADGIFPVSRYTQNLLTERGVLKAKTRVVNNGVDLSRFKKAEKSASAKSDGPKLLTLSRLVPRKGIDTVISALPQILESFPNLEYWVGGKGPDKERLESLTTDLGLTNHVKFLGYVPDEALTDYYAACDLFVMPVHHMPPDVEGFGIVFLEAAASGRASIATPVGGIPDAVEDGVTGCLIPPGEPAALAFEITRLLSSPAQLEQLHNNAYKRACTMTWHNQASRLLEGIKGLGGR